MGAEADYFKLEKTGVAPELGRWFDVARDIRSIEFIPGLRLQPLVGKNLLVSFVRFQPHTEAPLHAHDEEQVTVVVEGELHFEVDGETRVLRPGNAVWIPPHAPHAARTSESSCYEIDVFSPPRKALMALLEQQEKAEAARS